MRIGEQRRSPSWGLVWTVVRVLELLSFCPWLHRGVPAWTDILLGPLGHQPTAKPREDKRRVEMYGEELGLDH